jgi:hypothetical protein
MADVHALISWGIGSPADIPHLLMDGLSQGDVTAALLAVGNEVLRVAQAAEDTLVVDGAED